MILSGKIQRPAVWRLAPLTFCLLILTAVYSFAQDRGGTLAVREALGVEAGKQWAVFIAIDRYQEWGPLSNPVRDAREIRDILKADYYIDEVRELYDREATAGNIRRLFDDLKRQTGRNDSVFVFYAGHGQTDKVTNSGSWIPVDGGRDQYAQTNWLPNIQVRNMLANLPARHVFLVADSCFSGDILDTNRGASPEINSEYLRRAYSLVSRQVMTSGASESVPDSSEFAMRLKSALSRATEPCIDPEYIFMNVREVKATQPVLGYIRGSEHQQGGSFLFFRRQAAPAAAPQTATQGDTGSVQVSSAVAGMVVIDGADSGVRIKEDGTATISQVGTGRTSVAVRTDSGLVEAWPVVVQAGQTVRVRVEPPVSNADFTIEGTKLVKYTGASETPVIPWGITEVREYAFYDSKIRSVEIPASVTVIVHSAREGASFDIPTLTTISVDQGNPAFSSRDGVLFDKAGKILYTYPRGKAEVRYSIPAGVTAIGRQAFSESQLSSVSIPAGVTAIGGWAFSESQLSSVSIPASVTAIGDYAFSGTQLSSVSIPAGVTAIGSQAFNIQTLTTISVDQGNPAFSSRDGVLFDKAGKTLHTYPRGKPEVRYSIPAGVTAIGRQAFYRTQLSSVDIPASITAIGDSAFSGTQLSSVDIPASVTAIGDHAFSGTQLSSISIPASVTAIGNDAFSGTQLSSISIPASVTAIGRLIFDIPTLTAINVDQGNPAFSSRDGVLFDKAGKTLHTYPQGKTEVRYSIPASVTAIRDHAFYRTQLSSVDIPASVTAIGDFAFSGTQLSSVSIPASVTSIGSFTFSYCENLTRVELSRGTQVTNHVFNGSPVQLYYRD